MMLRTLARRTLSSKVIVHELPKLPYAYDALEPVLCKELMELHHTKHHAAYVTNLNSALQKQSELESAGDVAGQVALQPAIKFNGGGHVNHSIFWNNLAPAGKGGGGKPSGALSSAIDKRWGSFEAFKTDIVNKAMGIQGSGWAWLSYDSSTKGLTVVTCANQDPCSTTGTVPLLGIDMWEHAFYLSYKNVKANYLKEIWTIVNWKDVEQRFANAAK
jgi:Fe-Mn family superoxide dismutase